MEIVIRCPRTGRDVRTGVWVDAATFARSEMTGNSVFCMYCGAVHRWDKADARLRE